MDTVLRALAIYLFVLLLFRLSGKRTLAQITTFDFVLLLIIGESVQQGLIGDDYSVTTALLLVLTLITIDIGISLLKQKFPTIDPYLEGTPVVIVQDGKPMKDRMRKARVNEEDVMEAARQLQGLERMEQIKYAVLERNGGITVVPR